MYWVTNAHVTLSPKAVPIVLIKKQKQRQPESRTSLKKSLMEIQYLRVLRLKYTFLSSHLLV